MHVDTTAPVIPCDRFVLRPLRASESLGAIVEANPQGAEMLFGQVFQDNPASGKVLIHCGFKYLGDAEVFCVARDATVPTWTYLLKCE
jgi:RimJ/RimL family protein N-acetyltransferase